MSRNLNWKHFEQTLDNVALTIKLKEEMFAKSVLQRNKSTLSPVASVTAVSSSLFPFLLLYGS